MRDVLERKDKTSIFCAQSPDSHYVYHQKVRFVELVIALVSIVIGASIIILAH